MPRIVKNRALCMLYRNGRLALCFDYWNEKYQDMGESQFAARDEFAVGLQSLGISLKQDWRKPCTPSLAPDEWVPRLDGILSLLAKVGEKYGEMSKETN